MASWTPLLTTYAPSSIINITTWNELTGADGNLQYLYEQLIPEMYVNGQVTTSFIFSTNNLVHGINPNTYNDIRPSGLLPQIIDSSFTGLIKSRKEGLYLLSASTINTGSWNTPSIAFYKNNNQISESILNFIPQYASANESKTPNIINHFSIDRASEGDEYYAIASKTTGGDMNIQYPENYFSNSPYITNIFLNVPGINILSPVPIFLLDPNINLSLAENFNPMITPSPNDKWASSLVYSNSSTMYAFPDTVTTYTSNPLYWRKFIDSNNKTYTYPNTSSSFPISYATWRWSPQSTTSSDFDYCYMIIVLRSFDQLTSGYTNYEQNILSLHTIDKANEIIGTPISVTAHTNSANNLTQIWLRVAQRQLLIDEINPSSVGNGYILSLECGILEGGTINYTKIRCNTSVSGTREINLSSIGNLTSYNLSDVKIMTLGGIEFFSISNTQSNNKTTLSYYYVGNWRLSDVLSNPVLTSSWGTVIQENGLNYTQQKQFLWDKMTSEFNVSSRTESSSAGTAVSNAIRFNTFVFGDTTRFV
jgi:hypothetical protein